MIVLLPGMLNSGPHAGAPSRFPLKVRFRAQILPVVRFTALCEALIAAEGQLGP